MAYQYPAKGLAREGTSQQLFLSAEQTGTGAAQNVAHGLPATPTEIVLVPTDLTPATVGQYVGTLGTATATNVVATVTTGKKYRVLAWI